MEFFAAPASTPGLLEELAAHDPANPFCTPGYFRATERAGARSWIAGMRSDGRLSSASGVFVRSGRLNTAAEISSLPAAAGDAAYWSGLIRLCRQQGITEIQADSFGSPQVTVPVLPGELSRREREEHVLDLTDFKLEKRHRSSVRKAQAAGLTVLRSTSREAFEEHSRLMDLSHERRRGRGEHIVGGSAGSDFLYIECGCAELFQAVVNERVLSSAVILRAAAGAYYHTAGNTPEGLDLGASHFLLDHVAHQLREEGLVRFNLGGADPGSSLARFKIRFGASTVTSTAVSLYVGPAWRRKLTTIVRLARENPHGLRSALTGGARRMKVYAAETTEVVPASRVAPGDFRALSEDELRGLDTDPEFRARQIERLVRFGQSHAFGVFVEGRPAHISWLLPSEAVRIETPAILNPAPDEAEITACETLPEFRGRGIYPFVIRELFAVARRQGIRRIYMKTAWENKSSQAGILKAGLRFLGVAVLMVPPLRQQTTWVARLFKRPARVR